jgi:hypothetical protein
MDSVFDDAERVTRVWTEFATKMMSAGLTLGPDKAPPEVSRQMRTLMFQAMSQQAEQFMRSPQFLDLMKQSMDAAINMRKQINDLLTQAHHAGQGVARQDVDALLRSVHHLETRVLDRLEDVATRLDQITRRLDALEGEGAGDDNGSAASRRRSKTSPAAKTEGREQQD